MLVNDTNSFFERFIQVFWSPNTNSFKLYPDFYDHFIGNPTVIDNEIIDIDSKTILNSVFKWIDNGYYILNDLIEGILEVTPLSGTKLIHPNLFFGYDKENNILKLLNRNRNGKMAILNVSISKYLESIDGDYNNPSSDIDKNFSYPRFILLKCPHPRITPLSTDLIVMQLNEYLKCINSMKKIIFVYSEDGDSYTWGINVYDKMINYLLNKDWGNKRINIAIFHGFWEHKKIMLHRIYYLGDKGLLKNYEKHISFYREICEKSMALRLLCFKYFFSSKETTVLKMIKLLEEIRSKEIVTFDRILYDIKRI